MKRFLFWTVLFCAAPLLLSAQQITAKFGKGLNFMGKDSSFALKMGLRFQNQFAGTFDLVEGDGLQNPDASAQIRRARLKFDGWANKPKLEFKFELDLVNAAILDASVTWNFRKNMKLMFGQGKLPSNRERVISSGNLQFVDRSRLNSRFNIDRDFGLQFKNHNTFGEKFILRETVAISLGEGRNNTNGFNGGFCYTARVEALPMGAFLSKGDYIGAAIKRESTAKLSIGLTYDFNNNAVRERGQNGSYVFNSLTGELYGANLHTIFADMMLKYEGFSMMAEYANKRTDSEEVREGVFYTGQAVNVQAGYMFKKNYEVALRNTIIIPDGAVNEQHFTAGFSKYVVGHKLKVQADLTYIRRDEFADDGLMFRTQVDIHF